MILSQRQKLPTVADPPKPWTQSVKSTPATHVKLHTVSSSYVPENSTLASACSTDVRIILLLLISYVDI